MGTRDARGFTLIEVLIAIVILVVALVALLGLLSQSSLNVYVGGGQSKATSYARQMVEQLRNQPLAPPCTPPPPPPNPLPPNSCFLPPANGTDTPVDPATGLPETGITRTWTVAAVGATIAPNRLWRITVTVNVRQSGPTVGTQSITVETMRAE